MKQVLLIRRIRIYSTVKSQNFKTLESSRSLIGQTNSFTIASNTTHNTFCIISVRKYVAFSRYLEKNVRGAILAIPFRDNAQKKFCMYIVTCRHINLNFYSSILVFKTFLQFEILNTCIKYSDLWLLYPIHVSRKKRVNYCF